MIVMKFGGTSTQDAAAMRNVAQIVKARLHLHPIVVISAIAKATNILEQAGRLSAKGRRDEAKDLLKGLIDRHYAIVDENIKQPRRLADLRAYITKAHQDLVELTHGVSILRELTPRTLDAFCSYGELLSSKLIAATLCEAGMQAEWLDTKEFMITDHNFTSAMPLMEQVVSRLNKILTGKKAGTVFVTQGFIGSTEEERRTTMGRESSDYSAAIIGSALDVQDVQIWTDVDGILTGDPSVIKHPKKVKEMSFYEAYDLSFFGAKILHPNTMLPALEKNIPIHIYNSRRPNLSGSRVSSIKSSDKIQLKSVTSMGGITVIQISPAKRFSQYIFWEHIYSVLTRYRAIAKLTVTSEYNVAVALEDRYDIPAIVHDIGELATVEVHNNLAIVSLIGANIRQDVAILKKVFTASGAAPVSMISFGASGCNLSFIVPGDAARTVVANLHREFFENGLPPDMFEELEHSSVKA
ncbi:MAG: aspartate kinase [Bacteroidota bacterium]